MDDNLIDKWIDYHSTGNQDLFWAFERLNDMVQDAPEDAWSYIVKIATMTNEPKVLGNLAAGPLEDLLVYHGQDFIERIETKSRQVPEFTKIVKGVWQNNISKPVWERVHAIQTKYS